MAPADGEVFAKFWLMRPTVRSRDTCHVNAAFLPLVFAAAECCRRQTLFKRRDELLRSRAKYQVAALLVLPP